MQCLFRKNLLFRFQNNYVNLEQFYIMLGFMTLGVWHEQDSGIAGGRNHTCCSHYACMGLWPSESGTSKIVA